MDIRSFFKPVGATSKKPTTSSQPKKRPLIADSSDDEIIESTPDKQPKQDKKPTKRKKIVLSSDSDEDTSKKQKGPKPTKVNAADIFGTTPIKQSKVEVPKKVKQNSNVSELEIHDDPDFEKTLIELDESLLIENANALDKTIDDALQGGSVKKAPKNTPSKNTPHKNTPNKSTKRKKSEDEDTGIDPDQERHEKRQYTAMLYQQYLNRSGPAHHGQKEYPEGKPNCLKNLCFLRTGVLDSLESSEFDDLIKKYGGRTVHSVSKKVNYLVIGEQPGPAKMEKAQSYNIPCISEDELLDLILVKSGMKPKFAVKEETKVNKDDEIGNDKKTLETVTSNKSIKDVVNEDIVAQEKKIVKNEDSSPKKQNVKVGKEKKILEQKNVTIKQENKNNMNESSLNASKSTHEVNDNTVNENMMAWTEKYKPNNVKSIIGQQGDKSNMKKLLFWLQNWYNNHGGKNKTNKTRPSPWAKNDDGSYFKCALLSGPPGVGKTTTATLVAKELGFDIVEFNASDTRSKKLLHEEVSQLLSTTSLAGYFKSGSAPTKKHVLLMDEVDGMAGNEDRGGMQELINLIKNSNIPIICMCNDRNHQKIRSLANYCFDLRFTKPRLEQIRGAMMSICFKEKLNITPEALSEIIVGAGMDVRQTLNHLSLWTTDNKSLSTERACKEAKAAKKDIVMGPWEVIKKVFSEEDQKTMSLSDKSDLFFYDYSLGPLFVHENYLHVVPHCPKEKILENFAKAAESLSTGDLIDRKVRSGNNWSLLPIQAIYASVLPGHYLKGHFGGQINFPSWLGKNSSKNKFQRLLSELQAHMRTSISGSRTAMNLDYTHHICNKIIRPLVKNGVEGVTESVEIMNSYNLLREDLNSLLEVTKWPKQRDPMSMIDSKVKGAFTRAYNKSVILPYSLSTTIKKKRGTNLDEDDLYGEGEGDLSDNENEDDITSDSMIAVKKPTKVDKKSGVEKKGVGEKKGGEKKPGRGRGKKK